MAELLLASTETRTSQKMEIRTVPKQEAKI